MTAAALPEPAPAPSWSAWLTDRAQDRDTAGLRRGLIPLAADDDAVDLAGNDYLGLSRHPDVIGAAVDAAQVWGTGARASRLVTGTLQVHADLEAALAAYTGQPAALVTSTGYQANLAVVTALAGPDVLVVSDAHVHASLIDAVRLARARVVITPHNDIDAVRRALAPAMGAEPGRALVLTESIFSVLGDRAPLSGLAAACAEAGALLVVDEAHGLGVHGPGLVAAAGLAGRADVVVTATLSKALGSQGGAVLGSPAIIEQVVNTARSFIYDTALAPTSAAAAFAALRVVEADPGRAALVHRRMAELAGRLGVPPADGAVLSVRMASAAAALAAQADAAARGVRVGCFRPPSTPDGLSRLRITVGAGITETDWARVVTLLADLVHHHCGRAR